MKILGLMMVRNGEGMLAQALDSLAVCCNIIYALNDRSIDRTAEILHEHPAVSNVFTVDPTISQSAWFFPESLMLDLLYRMADLYSPDWVISIDHDQTIEPATEVRSVLSKVGPECVAVEAVCASVWNDPEYPLMVPLMSSAKRLACNIWRYRPGLLAPTKRLHNDRVPPNIHDFGSVEPTGEFVLYHQGWDTLQKRIEKVDLYTARDPGYELNSGIPYDRGLLFGYERNAVQQLVRDYEQRLLLLHDEFAEHAP
jgi:hypothetical protein